ncbi:MAG: T9SS type A sorting domain-containing protein [Prevotella sp.]|nr:T9SS type A sorting domain-containing protein [Prevotella sp.]
MRFYYLLLTAFLACSAQLTQAQTILDEDFETGVGSTGNYYTQPVARGEGWTTVNTYTGSDPRYVWHNLYSDPNSQSGSTISGSGCAACDGPISAGDGAGPREEILLSPELDLNDTYQLQFTWVVSPMNANDNSKYDFQVRVVTDDDLNGAETVFSIQNEQMLRESGVMVFPIGTWDRHVSKIDLSDWKGEKVKLAFVYKMLMPIGNVVWLDDITVKQWTPDVTPVPSLSLDRYNFGEMYIGEKMYTEVIRMTNTGKNGLEVTGMDLPEGVSCNTDFAGVNLAKYESVDFQLSYTASMTSPAQCDAIIHTTGGDAKVGLQATKQFVPDGYLLESFEGPFPPAGWRANGWSASSAAIEGDQSAYASDIFSNCTLRSPRLDLSDGGQVTFTYYNQYDGEYAPEYDIELQVSYDGGDNWTTKWISDYQNGLNQLLTETVDLGVGSDESYIRFFYPAVESEDEGAYDHSSFTLDRVLLPNVFGADGVPLNASLVKPANGAEGVYPRDIVLEWGPAQFAEGYKLYVGTNAEANNLIDGLDVGNTFTYTIPECDYETTYRWKVVGYNEVGNSQTASTWKFTTQPDASVVEFPYSENFDECDKDNPFPTGWLSTTTAEWENRRWEPLNTAKAYGGTGASMYTIWLNAGKSSTLTSPQFKMPAGKDMYISFVWGDNHPVDLIVDESGLLKKQNVEGGNGYSDVVFEIYSDGEWKQAAYLSEDYNEDGETKYWRYEKIDLTEFAGKTIQFRWTNNSYGGRHRGAGLDNIYMDGFVGDAARFNKEGWDAGKVNYMKAVNSGDQFSLINDGSKKLQVKDVLFNTDNFECSIQPGDEIAVNEGVAFNLQFNAKDIEDAVEDEMTIEFESGAKATFPVKGEGLAQDVLYYGFEANPLDYVWKDDFTMIDVDGAVNYKSNYYLTEIENDGGRYAFTQAKHSNENLTAHTGAYTLVAAAPDNNSAADDWLISKQICPSETSIFDFYARNLGTENSVFNGDNDYHSVGVYVSENGNTKTSDFKAVMFDTQMPYLGENEWNHYSVDLAPYAGKEIYVAVRHTTVSANWLAFFDDFTFTGLVQPEIPTAITSAAIGSNAEVEVYSADGQLLATGRGMTTVQRAGKGLFIVKVKDGDELKTLRIANAR